MFAKIRKKIGYLCARFPVVPVIRLHGVIGMVTPLRQGITLASCAKQLETAFSYKNAPAVAIVVNSPGGSPVQSHLIYQRIRALAEENEKQVLIFIEDVAASGGYMIALAGDEIIADESSIVGSIGVVSPGFGFPKALEKLGIERRVYAAGARKMLLDPFKEEKKEDIAHLHQIQERVHAYFIEMVKKRRNSSLAEEKDDVLFSGLFWEGTQAKDLGLVDDISDIRRFTHKRFGEDVILKLIPPERSWFPGRKNSGDIAMLPDGLLSACEERLIWSRFGL